jgi:molybdate transport system substrate-binding protein
MIRTGKYLLGLCLLLAAIFSPAMARDKAPLILAAASLQESLSAVADAWARKGHARPVLSFAASSALARQIGAGARADLFISADDDWMDAVQKQGLIRAETRKSFLSNRLMLIAPVGSRFQVAIVKGFPLARMLGDKRLAMADPDAVPAGKYGRAALESLDVWHGVEPKLARAENVRAALALVERGAAPLGIVYATDARASKKVRAVGVFPMSSHPPITYPVAVLKSASSPDAEGFRRFLLSRQGKAIFAAHGFTPAGK